MLNPSELRVAFTIVYEGLHHLKHNDFAVKMAQMFDHWIVVEGYSLPYGSTKWCNKLDIPAVSQDGTVEYMTELSKMFPNVYFYSKGDYFNGKDEQVNAAVHILKQLTNSCYLWEVDADEQWNLTDIIRAEAISDQSQFKGFGFLCNHYVGKGLVAKGDWGSGYFNRLWKWTGQFFKSHEPPMLQGQVGVGKIDDVRFEHYSYYFEKDVIFKSLSYKDHHNVHQGWKSIQKSNEFPIHISALFGEDSKIGKSNSYIEKLCKQNKDVAQVVHQP